MKQFFTLCMATAMIGTALNADAKMTLEKAMQLKSEGKAIKMSEQGRKNSRALKTLAPTSTSGFHRLMSEKQARQTKKNAAARITAKGDNIYGYLGYANDTDVQPIGLYDLCDGEAQLKWADPIFEETELSATCVAKYGEKLGGYVMEAFWGYIFEIYYVEYDFETGELLSEYEQDMDSNANYMMNMDVNPEDNRLYGYGYYDGEPAFMSVSTDDPFNYSKVANVAYETMCLSLCYSPAEEAFVGITREADLVKIGTDGVQSELMHLDIEDASTFWTGITYAPKSDVYYWNINYDNGDSAMATINPNTKTLDIYEELGASEEYMSLFTTDEFAVNPNRPDRPTINGWGFYRNSLMGTFTFTLPEKVASGENIKAESMEYRAYLDGAIYTVGVGAPGETIKTSFSLPANGNYTFGFQVILNREPSAIVSKTIWVGDDVPAAPYDVKIEEVSAAKPDEGKATSTYRISWNAVDTGIHGGYVNAKEITYKVSLNGEVCGTTAETSFDVELSPEADLAAYTAEVRAISNGYESSPSYSNSIIEGSALQLPVDIIPTPEQFELSTVLDNNEDGKTWELLEIGGEYFITTYYSDVENQMDDWYFLPKMHFDNPSKFYSFAFDVALKSKNYTDEYVEVLLCNEPTSSGVIMPAIIDEFTPESVDYETVRSEFRVPQSGDYYIAIHTTSDPDQYGIKARNFRITDDNIVADSPKAVEYIDATPGRDAKLEATISFTLPTLAMNDTPLAADAEITATITVADSETYATGKPGETVTKTVATEQGDNEIMVQLNIGANNSPVTFGSVYTGYNVPSPIKGLTSEISANMMEMTLTWEPVTTGWIYEGAPEAGIIDPSGVVYDVYVYYSEYEEWVLYDTNISETNYVFSMPEDWMQDYIGVGIAARNIAGTCPILMYERGILGAPYTVPFEEEFNSYGNDTNPWIVYGDNSWDAYYSGDFADNGDYENVSIVAQPPMGGSSRLGMPRITTKGCENAMLNLQIYTNTNLPKTTVIASIYGEEPEIIGEVKVEDTAELLTTVSIQLPAKYLNREWVGLFINVEGEEDDQVLAIERLSVTSASGVANLPMTGTKIIGDKGRILVSGLEGEDVSISTLDGRIAKSSKKIGKEASFSVEKGIYIVNAGSKKAKVTVK